MDKKSLVFTLPMALVSICMVIGLFFYAGCGINEIDIKRDPQHDRIRH